MKVKPKEVFLNLPIVLMFDDTDEIAKFAANINTLIHGKVKVKYEELGQLAGKQVGIFYLQRYDEYHELRESFMQMIDLEEMGTTVKQEQEIDVFLKEPLVEEFVKQVVSEKSDSHIRCDVDVGPCACGVTH